MLSYCISGANRLFPLYTNVDSCAVTDNVGCRYITKVKLALKFLHRGVLGATRVILLPGAWNPPTVAHLEIARAARRHGDEVICILPRTFPHKGFEGAGFEARCRMLVALARHEPEISVALSNGGLYADIAEEAVESLGPDVEIAFALGRDAAERIASWDYGAPGVFDAFVNRHRLLVAARHGEYHPDSRHRNLIHVLPMKSTWDAVSSSEVRRRIMLGENWSGLVPASIAELVREIYSAEERGMEQHERQLVVDQLSASGARLDGLVQGLTVEQWEFCPGDGRWSIGQCVEHVTLVEKRVMGSIGKKLDQGDAQPRKADADRKAKDAEVARLIPDRTVRRNAPDAAQPAGEWRDAGQMLAEFRKTRHATTEFAGSTQGDLRNYFIPHGLFGELDCYQWLLALSLHGERHACQIEEIKATPGYPQK